MTIQSANRLPDFIIIGAMKSATTTLQEQLLQQPGIFMCTPKEPNFFSDDTQFSKGMGWYFNLFVNAPTGALLGEASTHYTKLPTHPQTVMRLQKSLPHARLVYVMRHPIDRLISHYIHEWSMGNISCGIDEAIEKNPDMIAYSKYFMQLAPYLDAYGQHSVLPVFFDRLVKEPQLELERVCKFIGYGNKPTWIHDLKAANVSSERIRRFPLYNVAVESSIATFLRRTLIPRTARDWVKSKLIMRNRPSISPNMREILEKTFDQDLGSLGALLRTSLNCKNFKDVTSSKPLDWIARYA